MLIDKLVVGIADMKMIQGDGTLITYALGSCVGICFYDTTRRLAALLHIMLPANQEPGSRTPLKYADTGIRETLRQMELRGAMRRGVTAKIAGGAKMFDVQDSKGLGNIGQRNIEGVRSVLQTEGIRLLAEDVGGRVARTLSFDARTGQGQIRSYGRPEILF